MYDSFDEAVELASLTSALTSLPFESVLTDAPHAGLAVGPGMGKLQLFLLDSGENNIDGVYGNSLDRNVLYFASFFEVGAAPEGDNFVEVANFDLSIFGGDDGFAGPVLTGLAVLENSTFDLYAVQHFFDGTAAGTPDIPAGIMGLDIENEQVYDIAKFPGVRLEALGSSRERGSLFAVGLFEPDTPNPSNQYENLAVFEIDPRVEGQVFSLESGTIFEFSPYILNTWWGAAGNFNTQTGTYQGTGFSAATFDQVAQIGGAAITLDSESGRKPLLIGAFADVDSAGVPSNGFFLGFNPSAAGTPTDPYLMSLHSAGSNMPSALASAQEAAGTLAPVAEVTDPGPSGVDFDTIDFYFAHLSYSDEALGNGMLEQIFTKHFIETAQDPVFCAVDPLITSIETTLSNNANKTFGIGRTAYDLRNALAPEHPCGPALD